MNERGVNPPPPPRDFNVAGWDVHQKFRLRPTWFGFLVIEQLWEHRDGERQWRKLKPPDVIEWPPTP